DFADGVLQALQSEFADLFSVTRYLIDEISDDARAQIAAKLSEFQDHVEFRRLSEITDPFAQGIIFSNELIDAFPVHRVVHRGGDLRELCVALDQRDNFVWTDCELDDDLMQHCESLKS